MREKCVGRDAPAPKEGRAPLGEKRKGTACEQQKRQRLFFAGNILPDLSRRRA